MAILKIQTTAYAELAKGKSNEEVLEAVLRRHPKAKTTLGCISYYRSKMNKELDVTQRIAQRDTVVALPPILPPIELQARLVKTIEKLAKLEKEIFDLEKQTLSAASAAVAA